MMAPRLSRALLMVCLAVHLAIAAATSARSIRDHPKADRGPMMNTTPKPKKVVHHLEGIGEIDRPIRTSLAR